MERHARTNRLTERMGCLAKRSNMGQVIGLGQLRSHTCGYLDRVAAGETIEIVRRGSLVARIVSTHDDAEVARICTRPVKFAARGRVGRVALDELRRRAGIYFDRVAAGETIEVVRGGRPVARIASIAGDTRRSA